MSNTRKRRPGKEAVIRRRLLAEIAKLALEGSGPAVDRLDRAAVRAAEMLAAGRLDHVAIVETLMPAAMMAGLAEDVALSVIANRVRVRPTGR